MKKVLYYWHKVNYLEYQLLVSECLNEQVKTKLKKKLEYHLNRFQTFSS